jgi:hypothetical protein
MGTQNLRYLTKPEVKEFTQTIITSKILGQQDGPGFTMSMELSDKEKVAKVREKIYEVALTQSLASLF